MGQLVSKEPLSRHGRWRILARAENDMLPDGKGPGPYCPCRLGRTLIGVKAYRPEVKPTLRRR